MVDLLIRKEVQDFIRTHELEDEKKLVLKHRMIYEIPTATIAEQISGRRKAKTKLPLFYKTPNIVYPPNLNLEQCSSEKTALFKAGIIALLVGHDKLIADLTGGFGVDSFFISQKCKRLMVVEPNKTLLEFVKHNHTALGARNIAYHNSIAETFLREYAGGNIDCVFIDPSRRINSNQKVFKLSDCEPNILNLMAEILQLSDYILIKTSPLLDLQQGIKELKHVEKLWVVSVDNECKELLFLCRKNFAGDPTVTAVNLQDDHDDFRFSMPEEKSTNSKISDPLTYLYEPNASILKAGAFKLVGEKFSLFKLHPSTHLYTSNNLVMNFPGRIFKNIRAVKPDEKALKEIFPESKVNVITRNYPLTAEGLKKKTRLKDGGKLYLIGFTGPSERYLLAAERVK